MPMKISKLFCALCAFGVVLTAHAQSSVTLYGVADAAFVFNNNANGARQYDLASGVLQSSRWGLFGNEDLGAGIRAIFVLENGFRISNGTFDQGGAEFGRQAYIGLSDYRYGALTFGRQYDLAAQMVGSFASSRQWAGVIGAHPGDIDNLYESNRVNNAIKYTSPNFAGFKFSGLYGFGGVAGDFNRNRIFSLGARYQYGPVKLAAAYVNAQEPNFSFFGNNPNSNTPTQADTSLNMSSPIYSGYASAKTEQIIAAGAAYAFGPATVGATYSNVEFKKTGALRGSDLNPGNFTGTARFNNAEVNFSYRCVPALLLGIAYSYTQGPDVPAGSHAKYHQVNLGADYALSKRTDIYAIGAWQHASGYDSTNNPAVAAINGVSPSSTANQIVAAMGIRHRF